MIIQQGKFIVIEGLEGAGKSTAINTVKQFLNHHGIHKITMTREPGGTPIAEEIRDLVKRSTIDEPVYPETELLLMYASRAQHIKHLIKPKLEAGETIICDRFYLSSFAYQGAGRQMDMAFLQEIHHAVVGDFKADFTLYIDIDPEIGLKRAATRGELDRIEQEKIEFFNRARDSFIASVSDENQVYMVDGSKPLETVQQDISICLEKHLSI